MGEDTRGYLCSEVSANEWQRILTEKYNKVKIRFQDNHLDAEFGFIDFKDGRDKRSLMYWNEGEDSHIKLGCWGNSVEIITELLHHTGGKLEKNDCRDWELIDVPKKY